MPSDAGPPRATAQLASRRTLLTGRHWLPALVVLLVAGAIAALLALSLSGSSSKAHAQLPTVGVAQSRLGPILVNASGHAYYMFTHDKTDWSACTEGCERVWPPAIDTGTPTVGAGLSAAKLGAITRADHRRQLSYGGHPLYTFSEDRRGGQIAGEGFLHTWFVLSPAGHPVLQHGEKAAHGSGGY